MSILLQIIIREFHRLKKRPAAWVLLLVIPIGIFFYLGAIYEEGAIDYVPIAILDLDHSDLSRKVQSSEFNLQQLNFGKQAFVNALKQSLEAEATEE